MYAICAAASQWYIRQCGVNDFASCGLAATDAPGAARVC